MEVEYTTRDYNGKDRQETESIERFLYGEILYTETYSGDKERIRLEDQPKVVCEALGRLVEKLLDKGIFDLEDLKYIADANYGSKADSLQLKKGE